jgi:thiamine biosynthesis lipoprotein
MADVAEARGAVAVRRFRAMNTDIELRATDPACAPLLNDAMRVFEDVERRFSRFRPGSEICALNARPSARMTVTPAMLELLHAAATMHQITGGVFDPSILPELEAAGYDRSFELIGDAAGKRAAPRSRAHGFDQIAIDHASCSVTLPPGIRLDLGGIGKGWAVDDAASALRSCRDFLINAGGDIFAAGSDGHHDAWTAVIEHPITNDQIGFVHLRGQAMATSTTALRRWTRAGAPQHHLIDPRTGVPAETGVLSVSVIALTAVEAEVFAKSALILGKEEGKAFLRQVQCPGLFVSDGGQVTATADWPGRMD